MQSFRWMGEDLWQLTGPRLCEAADAYREALRNVPATLREPLEREHASFAGEAVDWLRRYNRSVHARIAGYLALGRRSDFAYPWPVVAILGIVQVIDGLRRMHTYGVLGAAAQRAGWDQLERIAEASDDVLKRTNRGIFADSVPTVLYALRAAQRFAQGDEALGRALLDGPLPLAMDEESRALARGIAGGLAIADRHARFTALAELTAIHFRREQAIFTHHLGGDRAERPSRRQSALGRRLSQPTAVPAPAIERDRRGARLVFRPYSLPPGFDMRDHDARVAVFTEAFVRSVTRDEDDFRLATEWVTARFEKSR